MQAKRVNATAVKLTNGKVLVVGGESALNTPSAALNTAELYDPGTNTWQNVLNTMSSPRAGRPVVVVLRPSGWVLVAGGSDASGAPVKTADIYDPAANGFFPANGTWARRETWPRRPCCPAGRCSSPAGPARATRC